MKIVLSSFCLFLSCICPGCGQNNPIQILSDFPAGNITVDSIRGNTVYLRPDLRDTGQDWFYWYFAVVTTGSDSVYFHFNRSNCLTIKGPAVSTDKAETWEWPEAGTFTGTTFRYFVKAGEETRFSMGMPYTQANFDRFIHPFKEHPAVQLETLCITPKKRATEKLVIRPADGKTARQKVLITARHHACEMMANYVLEGMIQTILSEDARMTRLRDRVAFWIIPFMDKDGVEDGDQGKARVPRDHNRDYNGTSLYCSTDALRTTVPEWSGGAMKVALDLHCPWIKGNLNEHIYLVGNASEEIARQQRTWMHLIAQHNSGTIRYDLDKGIVPYGTAWNTNANYEQGMSFAAWASTLDGIVMSTTFEIPYAVHNGQTLTPENLREFGKDIAYALEDYLNQPGPGTSK